VSIAGGIAGARARSRVLLELGQGGMGTVFLAVAEGPGGFRKLKVVKRLRPELTADPLFLQMFLDEARVSARLRHPNIAQTNEVGFDGDYYFIEMEYLEGQSLDVVARKSEALSLETHAWILAQTLAGLHHAHEQGVVHRDVSPHNVMVTYDGEAKLLDFGIAKAPDSRHETRTGVVKGKPTYMAPEQAAGARVDKRADLFAVGVMLWQAIAGKRLWQGQHDLAIFDALEAGEIPRLEEAAPNAPRELAAICVRALACDRDARFQTAAEMQAAIEAWLETRDAVGAREVGARVRDAFAEERRAARAAIDARLRARSEDETPPRASTETPSPHAFTPTGGDMSASRTLSQVSAIATRAASPAAHAQQKQQEQQQRVPRRRRFAIPIAAAAAAIAIGAFAIAARERPVAMRAPAVSVEHRTARAPLASEDCAVLADDAAMNDERTLWIGTMFPLTGNAVDIGVPNANAAELARRELSAIGAALPRRIGIVSCNDATNAQRAARHLADARVPAVIGFQSSAEAINLATGTFLPNGMLTIAALNTSAMVTALPQPPVNGEALPRLVWRTTFSTAQTTAATASVVENVLAPRVHGKVRVALVRSQTATGLAFSDALFASLRFNGKSALENGDAYRDFVTPEPGRSDASSDYARVVAGVLDFAPHVIVYVGDDELSSNVIAPVEDRWPRSSTHKPLWMAPGTLEGKDFVALLERDRERRHRFFGLSTPSATRANVQFTMRYNEAFDPDVTPPVSPSTPYDAVYAIAYAAFASDDAQISGASISRGFARIVGGGAPVDVGPAHVFDAIAALRAGKNIDLNGAASPLDLDRATGESPTDHVVLCVGDGDSGPEGVESGIRFDARTGKLAGEMHCP
jgi:serine/threonine-protein kinase